MWYWSPSRVRDRPVTSSVDRKTRNQKLVRLFTVASYVLSVSLVAVVLSVYYTVIWKPSPGPGLTRTGEPDPDQNRTRCDGGLCHPHRDRSTLTHTDPYTDARPGGQTGSDVNTLIPVIVDSGSPSAEPGTAEPPAVTAEDPSNLPTHRNRDPEGSGSGMEEK